MNVRATEMAASLPNTDVHFHLCVVDWVFEALPNALAVNFHVAMGLDEAQWPRDPLHNSGESACRLRVNTYSEDAIR